MQFSSGYGKLKILLFRLVLSNLVAIRHFGDRQLFKNGFLMINKLHISQILTKVAYVGTERVWLDTTGLEQWFSTGGLGPILESYAPIIGLLL